MEPADTPSETPFLDRLASADLTARERDVACFYEDRLPGAALLNLEEVCQGVGVSSATVARFARKLGYADFRDMTRSLRTRVRHDLSLPVERLRRLGDGGVPGRTVLGHRAALAQEAVSGVLACVDDEVLGRVGALVADADRPLYLGAVASGQPLLHYFGLLLSYLRGGVTVLRPAAEAADWQRSSRGAVELLEVVRRARPTVLIGTSTNHGAFTREVVEAVSAGVERPIILPLSNPTERIEAMPEDVIAWSGGKALVATGIPVAPFDYEGTTFTIGQGNNALLYPGLGLGVIVSGASRVTDGMLLAAAQTVASQVDPTEPGASLLPPVENLRASSATVAVAVARQAQADGVATASHDNLVQAVQDAMWQPVYGELA